jgi:chemotaxis protein methyltransferase WspC
LEQASDLAGQGDYRQAAARCEQFLREFGPDPRAYSLLGMIRQSAGDVDGAEICFLRAVYLDPQHDESLLALSLIYQRRGDSSRANRYRRQAERVHQRKATP